MERYRLTPRGKVTGRTRDQNSYENRRRRRCSSLRGSQRIAADASSRLLNFCTGISINLVEAKPDAKGFSIDPIDRPDGVALHTV